jgi:hypothetical protein
LRNAIVNFEQARAWCAAPTPAQRVDPSRTGSALGRPAEPFQLPPPSHAVTAFDEDHPEVRLKTDTTGVYAFLYDDLEQAGYPTGVPIEEVSVHRHEFMEGANPPYETVELPIEVDDFNDSGTFDSGDAIYCWVLSWAQRSGASYAQRYWGSGEVLYATRISDRPAQRLPSRSGWRNQVLTPLFSYPYSQRYEKNLFHTRTPPDTNSEVFHWTDLLQYRRKSVFPFETNHLDTNYSATISATWIGRRNASRSVWADVLNGRSEATTAVDSLVWFGLGTRTQTAVVHGSSLTEGATNAFRTWGKNSESDTIATVGFDAFQIGYWRRYQALGRRLTCNSGDAAGVYEIRAQGFATSAIRVYDVTDSLAPIRLDIDPSRITFDGTAYTVAFQDSTVGQRRRYVVFDEPKLLEPERYAAVMRRDLAGSGPANYLLVAPEAFLGVVQPLVDLRNTQGLDVLVAPVESIYDEFNGGRKSSYALKRFFRYAFDNWNAEFAIMLGDGSEDPQRFLGRDPVTFPDGNAGPDWIPAQRIMGPVPAIDLREAIPSDTWYVNFENGDTEESLPSLFIGRIPAYNAGAVAAVIQKIVNYESFDPDDSWRRNAVLLADDVYSTTTFFGGGTTSSTYCIRDYEAVFKALSERVRHILVEEAGLRLMNIEIMDGTRLMSGFPTYYNTTLGDTCRGVPGQDHIDAWRNAQNYGHSVVTQQIVDRLNAGALWWNYQGHANQYVVAHEDFYVNRGVTDDKNRLMNVGRPFFFSGFSCHPNGFAAAQELASNIGPSFGEEMVMLPDRGAIASWASSGYEILPTPVTRSEHLNTHLARALFADPPRDPSLGDNGARVVLGESIVLGLIRNHAVSTGLEQAVGISYLLLGDPATRLSIGAPQILVTANGDTVRNGEPVRLLSSGDTLRIEADLVSNVRLVSLTLEFHDALGPHTIPESEYTVTPTFPDTGVGSTGARRFHLVYRTTLGAGGVAGRFEIGCQLQTQLRAGAATIRDGDPIASDAELSLLLLSPTPIDPDEQLQLRLNGDALPFTYVPANNDTSGREWMLTWSHEPYPPGTYTLQTLLLDTPAATNTFRVTDGVRFRDLMTFPNPFDNEYGTRFSFTFEGPATFDLLIRVFTVSGRLIFERIERSLAPGYHQIPWDGKDAEGSEIANGMYFYKLMARSSAGSVTEQGRIVKLRRPHSNAPEETTDNP